MCNQASGPWERFKKKKKASFVAVGCVTISYTKHNDIH